MLFFFDRDQYDQGPYFLQKKYFPDQDRSDNAKLIAKHAVLFRNREALERLKKDHPDVHLVLLLRNPVERAFSAYLHQYKMDQEPYSFREVLDHSFSKPPEGLDDKWRWRYNVYFGLGCYSSFLKRIWQIFPKDRVHIYLTEELNENPRSITQHLFEKLELDPSFTPDHSKRRNVASEARSRTMARLIRNWVHQENSMKQILRKLLPNGFLARTAQRVKALNQKPVEEEQLGIEDRKRLQSFYSEWNEELKTLTGLDLSRWEKPQYSFKE